MSFWTFLTRWPSIAIKDTSLNGQLKKKMRRDDSEDSDSSDDEETDPYVLGFSGLLQKYSSAYARGGGDGSRC